MSDVRPLLALTGLELLDSRVLVQFPALHHVLLPADTPEAVRRELREKRPNWRR